MKQIIANFLRKLIKLDDYIEDRVFTEVERLEAEIEVINDLTKKLEDTFGKDFVNEKIEIIMDKDEEVEDK